MAGKGSKALKKGGKKGKGKGKGKKAKVKLNFAAVELESLELVGPDGSREAIGPQFRSDGFYYRNALPFTLGLHNVAVRATARELHSRVSVEIWTLPPVPKGIAAKKGAAAAKGKKAPAKSAAKKPAKGGKKAPGKKKGKGISKSKASPPPPPPAHLERWAGHVVETDDGASAEDAAAAAEAIRQEAEAAAAAASLPTLPAYVLNTMRAEMARIYDALRPLSHDPAARVTRDSLYALLHSLRLGIGKRDIDELFTVADVGGAGAISLAELEAMLRRCKPSCCDASLVVGRAVEPVPSCFEPRAAASREPSAPELVEPAPELERVNAFSYLLDDDEPSAAPPPPPPPPPAPLAAVESFSTLVRISIVAHDGSVRCHYFLELLCQPPPPTPPPPVELVAPVRALFEYHASIVPAAPTDPIGAAPARTVGLESFMACLRSTHLVAYAGDARAAFLYANRNKPAARVDVDGFWSCLFFAFVRASARVDGAWTHSPDLILDSIRWALVPIQWNQDACAVAERVRAAGAAMHEILQAQRNDQARATLHGDRWTFAPAKPQLISRSSATASGDADADGADQITSFLESELAAESGPIGVQQQAYLDHMHSVWLQQQQLKLWPV
jgi:hypothetical protein